VIVWMKRSEDRDDPHASTECAVQMIQRMGEAVVVECAGLRPSVLQFATGQIPNSTWSFQLGVELTAVGAPSSEGTA
jgi:hypothetical protein